VLAELLRKRVTGDLGSLDPSIKNSSFLNSSATNKGTTRCWTDDLAYSFLAYHVSDRFNAETNNPTVTELGDSFRLDSCWLECSLVWSLWKLSNTHMCGLPSIRICTKVWGQMGDPLKKQHFFPTTQWCTVGMLLPWDLPSFQKVAQSAFLLKVSRPAIFDWTFG